MPNPLIVTIHIDAGAAARECYGFAGPHTLLLSSADLASLSDVQRDTLARHFDREPVYAEPLSHHSEPVGRATIAALASLLDQRTEYVGHLASEARRMQLEPSWVGARTAIDRLRTWLASNPGAAEDQKTAATILSPHVTHNMRTILRATCHPAIRQALTDVWRTADEAKSVAGSAA